MNHCHRGHDEKTQEGHTYPFQRIDMGLAEDKPRLAAIPHDDDKCDLLTADRRTALVHDA